MKQLLLLPGIALLWMFAGCGPKGTSSDAGTETTSDGGEETDAGPAEDSGFPLPDAGPPDAGFGPVQLQDFCDTRALAECYRHVRCGELTAAGVAACRLGLLRQCEQAAYAWSTGRGRLTYSQPKATDCVNGYGVGSCTGTPKACKEVFAGNVAMDAGCVLEEECLPSGHCANSGFLATLCPGKCVPFQDGGAACSDNAPCGPSLMCKSGFCIQAEGAACNHKNGDRDCPEGFLCTLEDQCHKAAHFGEACGEFNGLPKCDDETFCRRQADAGNVPGTCQRRSGLGGACTQASPCLPGLHCSSLYQTGTCLAAGAAGSPCTQNPECQLGLFCSPQLGKCQPAPGDGGVCGVLGSGDVCQEGYYCDMYGTDLCLPLIATGGKCPSYLPSGNNVSCQSNHCEAVGFQFTCVAPCFGRVDGGI